MCASHAENLQLRQGLHTAKQAAEPSVVQLRQLLLDPAVNRCAGGWLVTAGQVVRGHVGRLWWERWRSGWQHACEGLYDESSASSHTRLHMHSCRESVGLRAELEARTRELAAAQLELQVGPASWLAAPAGVQCLPPAACVQLLALLACYFHGLLLAQPSCFILAG